MSNDKYHMQYNQLLIESSRGIFVRFQDSAMGTPVVFKSKEGRAITAFNYAIFPEDEQFYENDTVDILPAAAKRLPLVDQKKLLKTGQQKVMEVLEIFRRRSKILPQNWNVVNANGRSAFITLWKNEMGEKIGFVKLFNTKSLGAIPFFWSNSDFARDTGYAIQNGAQQKSELNLKPSTVVGVGDSLTLDEILEQVKTNMPTRTELPIDVQKQVVKLIKNVHAGFDTPVANAAQYSVSYEVDLGETAAPIALLTGHFVSGAYREVEEQLLKPLGSSWGGIQSVSFPMSGSEALIDSYLNIDEDTQIGISSKDGRGGAAASVSSLIGAVEKNPERYDDMVNERKYKYLFNTMHLIKDKSAEDGPLELGVIYKFITKDEKIEIKKALGDLHMDKKRLSKNLRAMLKDTIYKPNLTSPNYSVGLHLLTILAYKVAEKLNKNTAFVTSFFKEVLARSNVIQVKTNMKKSGSGAAFSNFIVIWPPVFSGNVKFYAGKCYSASARPSGKLCFKIG